jgi:aryl-alcohol dehydrogenase-like predicted oxidoreductase
VLRVLVGGALIGATPLPALTALADEIGADVPTLALRFALSNEMLSTAIVGFSDTSQIEAAAKAAAAGLLPTDVLARIAALQSRNFI